MTKLRIKIVTVVDGWAILQVIDQPDPWPANYMASNMVLIARASSPAFSTLALYVRGADADFDWRPFAVLTAKLPDIRAAVREFNQKHAGTDPVPNNIIE